MKLTAKRISKLRKRISRYRLYTVNHHGEINHDSYYYSLYGLDCIDAVNRHVKKIRRTRRWYDKEYKLIFLNPCEERWATHALVPEGIKQRKEIIWMSGGRW